jgi:hypothetical protein
VYSGGLLVATIQYEDENLRTAQAVDGRHAPSPQIKAVGRSCRAVDIQWGMAAPSGDENTREDGQSDRRDRLTVDQ